jgi:nucleoid-associated protein YgaU
MSTTGSLEKAEIEILNGKKKGEVIECKFNPPEYTTQKEVTYGELQATGSGASVQQFVSGRAERLSVELFFDTSEQQADVRSEYLDDLDTLVEVDPELHAPPICQFVWGDGIIFDALVESLDKQFTMFLPSGVPVRARVNVVFTEYKTSEYHQSEVDPESTDKTKSWTVTQGDTLWLIAAREYDDPSHWRTIAQANDIQNPRGIEPGTSLELPPL